MTNLAADGASDAQLVAAAQGGDKGAFGTLAARHRPLAVGVCARFLGDGDLAMDVVNEAVVVALVDLPRLSDPERFGSWLCGIALNLARQRLRRRGRVSETSLDGLAAADVWADHSSDPAELAATADLRHRVRVAIDGLATGQQEAVLLFYLQELSYREVAAELGISINAVKARLHQARAALEPRLAEVAEPVMQPEPRRERTETAMPSNAYTEMSVREVRRSVDDDALTRRHVIVLEEGDGDRCLPIWVGPVEATALALDLERVATPRPLTYRFTANLLAATGASIKEIQVTKLEEGTFYAVVVVESESGVHQVDARPSDAINLAVIADVPIKVDSALIDEAAGIGERFGWRNYEVANAAIAAEIQTRVREEQRRLADEGC